MLFQQRFKERIRSGEVTATFRIWKAAKVVVGNDYRLGPDDVVVVTKVDEVALGAITDADARRAGHDGADALVAALRKLSKTRLSTRSKVFRIRFRHETKADPRTERRADASKESVAEVLVKLERMDARSKRGPWTTAVLQAIAEHPEVAASKLAPRFDRETRAFKADVRKLKELGLTVSHEVGYSLSPRGKALLGRLGRR